MLPAEWRGVARSAGGRARAGILRRTERPSLYLAIREGRERSPGRPCPTLAEWVRYELILVEARNVPWKKSRCQQRQRFNEVHMSVPVAVLT